MYHDKVNRSLQTFRMLPAKSCNVLNPNTSMKNIYIPVYCIYIPEFHDTRRTKEVFHSENIILSRFHVSTKKMICIFKTYDRDGDRGPRDRDQKNPTATDRDREPRDRDRDTTSGFTNVTYLFMLRNKEFTYLQSEYMEIIFS